MSKYDDLFDETAPEDSVFADKGALDPLAEPDEIIARDEQERELATILNGVHEGYLPTTVSIYGPPGTGKTITTRRFCREFATRMDSVGAEYVNLKEWRTIFSAANEILFARGGEKRGSYAGLDGVFEERSTARSDASWRAQRRRDGAPTDHLRSPPKPVAHSSSVRSSRLSPVRS